MNKSIITRGRALNSVLALGGFVLVSLLVIVWFLPRNNTPQMRYDVGKPWMYGSLIAKFDFPIYKSDQVVQQERDSLLALFQPYYHYDRSMEKRLPQRNTGDARGADANTLRQAAPTLPSRHHWHAPI